MTTAAATGIGDGAPEGPTYLVPAEVAGLLRVSTKTVYRLASQDPTLPALRLGGSLRFPRERLLRWLQAREQGGGRPRRRAAVKREAAEPGA